MKNNSKPAPSSVTFDAEELKKMQDMLEKTMDERDKLYSDIDELEVKLKSAVDEKEKSLETLADLKDAKAREILELKDALKKAYVDTKSLTELNELLERSNSEKESLVLHLKNMSAGRDNCLKKLAEAEIELDAMRIKINTLQANKDILQVEVRTAYEYPLKVFFTSLSYASLLVSLLTLVFSINVAVTTAYLRARTSALPNSKDSGVQ